MSRLFYLLLLLTALLVIVRSEPFRCIRPASSTAAQSQPKLKT